MLLVLTVLIMFIVAYAYFREGLFTSCAMLVNVVLAGVLTFNFYEPLAGALDATLDGSFLDGYQDFVVMVGLFAIVLGLLRMFTNNLANSLVEFSPLVQQFGGAAVGLLTGYLVAGFLVCALETLPWHKHFMDFEPRTANETELRRLLPADRVWLALMRHASAYAFAQDQDNPAAESVYDQYPTFDRSGTFEQRYYRYRRYSDGADPQPYLGELDKDLLGPRPAVPPPNSMPPPALNAAPQVPPQNTVPPAKGPPEKKPNIPGPAKGPGTNTPAK